MSQSYFPSICVYHQYYKYKTAYLLYVYLAPSLKQASAWQTAQEYSSNTPLPRGITISAMCFNFLIRKAVDVGDTVKMSLFSNYPPSRSVSMVT